MFDELASVRSQAREQGRRLHDEENDVDGKLAQVDVRSLLQVAQRSWSSVIFITSWRLHVQVFAVGESTGDESILCIEIQKMPTQLK